MFMSTYLRRSRRKQELVSVWESIMQVVFILAMLIALVHSSSLTSSSNTGLIHKLKARNANTNNNNNENDVILNNLLLNDDESSNNNDDVNNNDDESSSSSLFSNGDTNTDEGGEETDNSVYGNTNESFMDFVERRIHELKKQNKALFDKAMLQCSYAPQSLLNPNHNHDRSSSSSSSSSFSSSNTQLLTSDNTNSNNNIR